MRHLFHCNWGQMAATYLAIYYRMLSVHNDLPRGRHHERWHLRRCQFALGRSPRGQGCSHASFFLLSFFLFFLLSFFLSSFFSFGGAIVKDSYRGICCFSASLLLCFSASLLLSASLCWRDPESSTAALVYFVVSVTVGNCGACLFRLLGTSCGEVQCWFELFTPV